MEMHQIKYFLSVAEERHISRAAEKCHVSQPSLSRAIKKLEEELGGLLFQRKPGRVNLTSFGEHILPFLRNSYEQALCAKKEARSFLGVHEKLLRVGLVSSVYHHKIVAAFERITAFFHGLDFRLQQGSAMALIDLLGSQDLDISIGSFPIAELPESLDAKFLYRENYVVCFPEGHAFQNRDAVHLEEAQAQPLLMFALPPEIETKVSPPYDIGQNGSKPMRVNLFSACFAKAMLNQGFSCAIVPEFSSTYAGLQSRPLAGENFHRDIYVLTSRDKTRNSVVNALIGHLCESEWRQQ